MRADPCPLTATALRRTPNLFVQLACFIQPCAHFARAALFRPVAGAKRRRFDEDQRELQRLHQMGQPLLSEAREIVIMVKPAALEPAGAVGANRIAGREVARVGTVFEVDIRANEHSREIEHLDNLLSHRTLPYATQASCLDTLDPGGGQTFIGVALVSASPRVPKSLRAGR